VQWVAASGVVLQFRPGIGKAAFIELGIGVHERLFVSVRERGLANNVCRVQAPRLAVEGSGGL
jgi:hypothetical protein